MDKDIYIQEAKRQLTQSDIYEKQSENPTETIIQEVRDVLKVLHEEDVITEEMRSYANPEGTVAARFYILPKVHKRGVPGRPVISGCNSPTEKLSEVVDSFLKPLVPTIPTHIKDTRHFLSKLRALDTLPRGCILATIDVVGLYPSIPHVDGLEALRSFLQDQHLPLNVTNGVVKMAEIVLKRNVFEFGADHYVQVSGTAIGTKMAPSYANIFMAQLEARILEGAALKPMEFWRYIDDCFVLATRRSRTTAVF